MCEIGYTGDRFAKEMPRGSAQPEAVARTVGAPWQKRFYYRACPPSRLRWRARVAMGKHYDGCLHANL